MDNESLKLLLLKINKEYDKIAEYKEEYRKEKIKRIIEFFEIKDTDNVTHAIVNPKYFPIFKEYLGDVIDVYSASFAPEIQYWQFHNLPEASIKLVETNIFQHQEIEAPKFDWILCWKSNH